MVILLKKYHPYIYILRMGEKREVERSSQLPVGWKSMKRPEPSGREINYHISPEGKHFRSLTSALASIKHATEPSFVEASAIAAAEPEPVNPTVPGSVYLIRKAECQPNVYKVGYTEYSLFVGKEYFKCDNKIEIQILFNRTVLTLLESEVLHNI